MEVSAITFNKIPNTGFISGENIYKRDLEEAKNWRLNSTT